jgi:hypothetical protein
LSTIQSVIEACSIRSGTDPRNMGSPIPR